MTELETPLVVRRWKRYGHDRAYVRRGDVDLGYRDLQTAEVVASIAGSEDAIRVATEAMLPPAAAYVAKHAQPAEPAAPPRQRPTRILLPDRDLALNVPGSAAGARAQELRDAAPVRTFFERFAGLKTDERAWRIGAKAEREVGHRLTGLDERWRVLHAVPVGDRDSDIDHVVIGPGGVFTVNTKNHPDANVWVRGDTVKVNGSNQPYVRNSRHEAQRAARFLSDRTGFDVEVGGIIAVMGAARGFTVKTQPADGRVHVTTRRQLVAHLRGLPEVLGMPSIERIYLVARHLATWQPKSVEWTDF